MQFTVKHWYVLVYVTMGIDQFTPRVLHI